VAVAELDAAAAAAPDLQRRAGLVMVAAAPVAAGAFRGPAGVAVARMGAILAQHQQEPAAGFAPPRHGAPDLRGVRQGAVEMHHLADGGEAYHPTVGTRSGSAGRFSLRRTSSTVRKPAVMPVW